MVFVFVYLAVLMVFISFVVQVIKMVILIRYYEKVWSVIYGVAQVLICSTTHDRHRRERCSLCCSCLLGQHENEGPVVRDALSVVVVAAETLETKSANH